MTRRGFTLLEVLLATIVFVVGVTAVIQAFSIGIYATGDVENVNIATNIAQGKMEEIVNTPFANIVNSGPTPDANFPRFFVTVVATTGNNPMLVGVTVSWNAKGAQTSVVLTTLVANYS